MATIFERFSSKKNLELAYKYVQNELARASLAVSPINHPALTAIDALGEQFFVALEQYLRDEKYAPERGFFVYIPKDNLGLRPVCILSIVDRIVYQALFNQNILGFKIDGQLSDKVCFAHRVNDKKDADAFISPYINNWNAFCKNQKKSFEKGFVWKTEFDIQQYYENIPISPLIEKLKTEFGIKDEKLLALLNNQLSAWVEHSDLLKGIPQGPSPSAVLANVYLSSLDRFAEKELIGKDLRYFRYVDDIVLMGKTKETTLKATEKIVHFLRAQNLNLNEKTRLTELEDAEPIEQLRIASHYDEDTPEIPDDEFTRIQEGAPYVLDAIVNHERIDRLTLRELKYYLAVGKNYDLGFILKLIEVIPLRPSLVVPIIQYVGDARDFLDVFGDPFSPVLIDNALWDIYNNTEVSQWSKFWILKLLASKKDVLAAGIKDEVSRIISSREPTIFKVVGFYYEALQERKIELATIKQAIQECDNEIEKSLYSFFFLNSLEGARAPTVRSCIEKTLNAPSHEMNLVGCYLYQSNPKITIEDIDGTFSAYILKRKKRAKKRTKEKGASVSTPEYYIVRSDALAPFTSPPASILGVKRKKRKRGTVDLQFPEMVQFAKVTLKVKEGKRDIEIFYDGNHLITADYAELGFFVGEKQQKPSRPWGFLCALSVLIATKPQEATPYNMCTMVASEINKTLSIGNVHQIKRSFVKKMREIFKTDDDPFHKNSEYYEPKFILLPEPELRREEVWRQGGSLNENLPQEQGEEDEYDDIPL